MKLNFKFREASSPAAREQVVRALKRRGASAVRRLFPDEQDEELASIYVVECDGEATGRDLLKYLNAARAVEYAEGPLVRKLQRPA